MTFLMFVSTDVTFLQLGIIWKQFASVGSILKVKYLMRIVMLGSFFNSPDVFFFFFVKLTVLRESLPFGEVDDTICLHQIQKWCGEKG